MENSIGSSVMETLSCEERNDYPEESGWTNYFGDQGSMDTEKSDSYSDFQSTSSVSDVVSGTKGSFNHQIDKFFVDNEKIPKKLSFKKRFDEELEDTACSPNNSPKVTCFKQFNMQPTNKDKGNASGIYSNLQGSDQRRQLGFNIQNGNEITELNKRGLCVVPLSAFMNYQG